MFIALKISLGMSSSGYLSTYFYTYYGPSYPTFYSGLFTIIAPVPLYILINSNYLTSSFIASLCIAIIAGTCAGVASPIVKSTVINVIPPPRRGIASALHILFDDVGKGLGPYLISLLIQLFQGDRKEAFNIGFIGWIVCGLLLVLVSKFVESDEEAVAAQQRLLGDEEEWEDTGICTDVNNPTSSVLM